MNISAEEYARRVKAWLAAGFDPALGEVQIGSEIIARQLEEEAVAREIATTAGAPPLPNGMPVMSEPTSPSAGLSIECIAGYLDSDPHKTAKALGNLAAGGYVIRVSSNPDRWVRVVPVGVEMVAGVARPLAQKAAQ